jgi:hypothetical protein
VATTWTTPTAPTIGTVTAASAFSVRVPFIAPIWNGGTFVTSCKASSSPVGGSICIGTSDGSSPITVSGLSAATSYTFDVTCSNAVGNSPPSAASSSITTSAAVSSSMQSGSSSAATIGGAVGGGLGGLLLISAVVLFCYRRHMATSKVTRVRGAETATLTIKGKHELMDP